MLRWSFDWVLCRRPMFVPLLWRNVTLAYRPIRFCDVGDRPCNKVEQGEYRVTRSSQDSQLPLSAGSRDGSRWCQALVVLFLAADRKPCSVVPELRVSGPSPRRACERVRPRLIASCRVPTGAEAVQACDCATAGRCSAGGSECECECESRQRARGDGSTTRRVGRGRTPLNPARSIGKWAWRSCPRFEIWTITPSAYSPASC